MIHRLLPDVPRRNRNTPRNVQERRIIFEQMDIWKNWKWHFSWARAVEMVSFRWSQGMRENTPSGKSRWQENLPSSKKKWLVFSNCIGWIHGDPTTFWKSLFLSTFLCSIARSAIENRFGRISFVNYAWNTGESGQCLGTPMEEADLIDSSGVWRWYFRQR